MLGLFEYLGRAAKISGPQSRKCRFYFDKAVTGSLNQNADRSKDL